MYVVFKNGFPMENIVLDLSALKEWIEWTDNRDADIRQHNQWVVWEVTPTSCMQIDPYEMKVIESESDGRLPPPKWKVGDSFSMVKPWKIDDDVYTCANISRAWEYSLKNDAGKTFVMTESRLSQAFEKRKDFTDEYPAGSYYSIRLGIYGNVSVLLGKHYLNDIVELQFPWSSTILVGREDFLKALGDA